ncbi:MAG TPA: phosphoribosyltransferase family protein [Bacteroidia bacterium]
MKVLLDLVDFLFPRLCAGCSQPMRRSEISICKMCEMRLPITGISDFEHNQVADLFRGRVRDVQAFSFLYFRKSGLTQDLMHQIKYKGNVGLAKELGRLMALNSLMHLKDLKYLVTCIPMHPSKRKRRGYNQSELIAESIANTIGLAFHPELLLRLTDSESQTKKKRYDRWENSVLNYQAKPLTGSDVRSVILVDDIITTGATIEACVHALQSVGIRQVLVCTMCVTVS